jgi:hypothetical protein
VGSQACMCVLCSCVYVCVCCVHVCACVVCVGTPYNMLLKLAHTHTHTHTQTHTNTHTNTQTHIHTQTHTRTHTLPHSTHAKYILHVYEAGTPYVMLPKLKHTHKHTHAHKHTHTHHACKMCRSRKKRAQQLSVLPNF